MHGFGMEFRYSEYVQEGQGSVQLQMYQPFTIRILYGDYIRHA
jgi:hypothetical protein